MNNLNIILCLNVIKINRYRYIIQSCSNPVNNSIMELLLLSTAARRADAENVIVVIPYFGYKYHRRGLPISTTLKSR